jgi:hypothetical protein
MARTARPATTSQKNTTARPTVSGKFEKGLVGSISADQVTNIQVGPSNGGVNVQPATGDNASKK